MEYRLMHYCGSANDVKAIYGTLPEKYARRTGREAESIFWFASLPLQLAPKRT